MDGYMADDDEHSSIDRVSTCASIADSERQSVTEELGADSLNGELSTIPLTIPPEERNVSEKVPWQENYLTPTSGATGPSPGKIPIPELSYHDFNGLSGGRTLNIPENTVENARFLPSCNDDVTFLRRDTSNSDTYYGTVASAGPYVNDGFYADMEDTMAYPAQLSKRVSSMPSLYVTQDELPPPHSTMISSSITYPSPLKVATAPKELGLLDDLMNLGQPKDQRVRPQVSQYTDIYPYRTEDRERAEDGYKYDQVYREETLMSYVEQGYISDTTDLVRNDPDLYPTDGGHCENVSAIGHRHDSYTESPMHEYHNEIAQSAPEDQGMLSDLTGDPNRPRKKRRKHSRKGKERRRRRRRGEMEDEDIAEYNDGSRPSSSQAGTTSSTSDGRSHSRGSSGGSRTRHDLLRPNSMPGAYSDDEFLVSSVGYRSSRRSAPVFSRRGFSGSEVFWKSGQTSIQRTHIQDVASAHGHGARSPGLLSKITRRKGSGGGASQLQTERRGRALSTGAANIFGAAARKFGRIKDEPGRENKTRDGVKNYGSTANVFSDHEEATYRPDQRGYHSECEAKRWSYDYTPDTHRQTSSREAWPWVTQLTSPTERDDVAEEADITANHLQREAAVQSSRGVFRTPQSMVRKDLHVKIKETPTAVRTFSVNKAATDSIKQTPATVATIDEDKPSDEGTGSDDEDDDDDEGDDDEEDDESSSVADSDKPELRGDTKTEVYARRWYLLFLFSVCNFLWNAIWSTWGPIAQSAKAVYNWDDGDIAMFTWLGNIPFFFVMFPIAYLMDVKGMRVAMVLCCGLMFAGAGLRCIPSDISTAHWLINGGQLLNGIAGTVPCSGPALLSGLWFPPSQRATATAISTIAGYLGACFSFVAGPLLVPEPNLSPVNNTYSIADFSDIPAFGNTSANSTNYEAQKEGIMNTLYIECGTAGVLFLLVLIYFPSKPPLPPSISASIPREKYVSGIKMLVRNKQFWITAIAYGLPIGVYEVWQVVLDVNLDPMVSQQTAGWLDFYATLGGCVSGLLVSRFADFFTRQMKLFLLVFYFFAAVAILWFTLVVLNILPFDTVSIYAAIIIGGVFLDGGAPLFFELVIEVAYPVGEGVTSGLLQLICAGAGIIFLSLVQIESLGKQWMNWCYFGTVTLAIPLLFFINTTYGRADIDDMEIEVDSDDEEEGTSNTEEPEADEKTALLPDNQC